MNAPYFRSVAPSLKDRTETLKHYTAFLDQAREAADAANDALAATKPDFDRAARAQRMEAALRCAQFEARHQGVFNWSGKEIYRKETV